MLSSDTLTHTRIILCTNDACVLRKSCYRAQAEPEDGSEYRRFLFEEKYNQVSCEHQIAIAKLPMVEPAKLTPSQEQEQFFNDAFAAALAEANRIPVKGEEKVTMATKKERVSRATKETQLTRVRIIRDAIRAGKNNRDIYAACKKETGLDVNPNMVSQIRSGTYNGWGVEILKQPGRQATADTPSAAPPSSAGKNFKTQLRCLQGMMPSHGISSLTLHDDGRVETEMITRQSWNLDDA